MPDVLTLAQRRCCMLYIRSKATKPEILVRKWLWAHGYRYRLNVKSVPGKADTGKNKKTPSEEGVFLVAGPRIELGTS